MPRDKSEKAHPLEGVDDKEKASPLGRGADPGSVGDSFALSDRRASVAGRRGAQSPGAAGGPEGFVERENEDVVTDARRGDGDRPSS